MATRQDIGEEILDVEAIMEEIRGEIALRRQQGELEEPDLSLYRPLLTMPPGLEEDQKELNTRWDGIYEPFEVRSRTPLLGRLWAAVRGRIHGEVRTYLDPMVWRQTEFNAAVVRTLNVLVRELYGGPLANNLQALNREVTRLQKENQALKERLQQLERVRPGGGTDE